MAQYTTRAQRTGSAIAAGAIVAAMAMLLALGLRGTKASRLSAALVAIALDLKREAHPPPPVRQRPAHSSAADGQPSPPNLKAQASPVVAKPVQPLLPPPPIITAPVAGVGAAPANGAAPVPGPGQGAGGAGDGLGGGDGGDGYGEPSVVGPRRTAGKLSIRDLPDGLIPPGRDVAVTVLFRVGADGKVTECHADRTSGFVALDRLVCDLIEQRFRYRPALGRSGRPVASRVIETHSWYVEPEPPPRR